MKPGIYDRNGNDMEGKTLEAGTQYFLVPFGNEPHDDGLRSALATRLREHSHPTGPFRKHCYDCQEMADAIVTDVRAALAAPAAVEPWYMGPTLTTRPDPGAAPAVQAARDEASAATIHLSDSTLATEVNLMVGEVRAAIAAPEWDPDSPGPEVWEHLPVSRFPSWPQGEAAVEALAEVLYRYYPGPSREKYWTFWTARATNILAALAAGEKVP